MVRLRTMKKVTRRRYDRVRARSVRWLCGVCKPRLYRSFNPTDMPESRNRPRPFLAQCRDATHPEKAAPVGGHGKLRLSGAGLAERFSERRAVTTPAARTLFQYPNAQ